MLLKLLSICRPGNLNTCYAGMVKCNRRAADNKGRRVMTGYCRADLHAAMEMTDAENMLTIVRHVHGVVFAGY